MSSEDEKKAGLVPSRSVALSRAGAIPDTNQPEFWPENEYIAVGTLGKKIVEGLYCVICGGAAGLEDVLCDAGMPAVKDSARARLSNSLIQFWLVCVREILQKRYGEAQSALVVEVLCARCFRGPLPDEEVCLAVPLTENEKRNLDAFDEYLSEPVMYRLMKLVERVPGGERVSPVAASMRFKPVLMETFASDCEAVLTATEPNEVGAELMCSFSDRCRVLKTSF